MQPDTNSYIEFCRNVPICRISPPSRAEVVEEQGWKQGITNQARLPASEEARSCHQLPWPPCHML